MAKIVIEIWDTEGGGLKMRTLNEPPKVPMNPKDCTPAQYFGMMAYGYMIDMIGKMQEMEEFGKEKGISFSKKADEKEKS